MTDAPDEIAMPTTDLLEQVTKIVSAFVSNNAISAANVPALISSTHAALLSMSDVPSVAPPVNAPTPAVPIKKSITDNYIICLDDGKRFKSLRRHLGLLGMTPDEYRDKWGLPSDYPMVAPQYAATRSALAKNFGLGRSSGAQPKASMKRARKAKLEA